MCFNKILCLFLLAGFATSLSAQDDNTNLLDSFSAKFITTIRASAKERAYLVADKSVYKAGEYIWFNALLLNTASQKLSSKSKLLYIDIVDENDHTIKHMMLDAANQQLYSRIQLPDTLTSGYYWLRAYTKQMTVQDTGNIGITPLYVLGNNDSHPVSKPAANRSVVNDQPSLTFYPEGGNMITGIDATVAVLASDKNSAPLNINGFIKDSRDTVVTTFATNTNGLGKFQFEPSGYRHYRAVINYEGKEWSYPLPPFNYHKGQLAVTRQPGTYQVRVLLGDSIYKKEALTYVVGISKDSLVFAAFGKGLYQVSIDENKLPQGITTFYLFDTKFNLLSERTVYANSNDAQVNITPDKNNYTKREKVSLNISVTDASQHPIPALISVAVSDSLFTDKHQCQFTDVVGVTAVDNLFFATHNCFSDEEKDLLMLTYSNSYATLTRPANATHSVADDNLFYISGKVLNGKAEGASKIVSFISNAGSDGLYLTDTTDNNGRFSFTLDNIPDSSQYALEIRDLNNHVLNTTIETDPAAFPEFKTPAALKQTFTATLKPAIDKLTRQYDPQWYEGGEHHLPPVMVKGEKAVDYDISKRVSPFSAILSGNDFDGRTSVDNVILRVGGLQVVNGFLLMRGLFSIRGTGAATEPLLLVDGAQVSLVANSSIGNSSPVLSYLSNLDPKSIDFIEVLKDGSASNYGVRGANGVILVNTTNKSRNFNPDNNMKIFYAKGVSRPTVFPVRMYSEKDKKTVPVFDNRSTLLWNGHYLTGKEGNALFTFYTSDVPATYTITVTGITQHGDIIYKTANFRSK